MRRSSRERAEDERLAGGEGHRAGGVLAQVHDAAAVLFVDAVAAQARRGRGAGRPRHLPDVDVVGVRRGHDALGDGLHEGLQVRGAGDLLRERDELAHRAPPLVEFRVRRRDVEGVADEARDGARERQMRGSGRGRACRVSSRAPRRVPRTTSGAQRSAWQPRCRSAAASRRGGGAPAQRDGRRARRPSAPASRRGGDAGLRGSHVLAAGVDADEHLDVVAVEGEDLAARGAGELEQDARGAPGSSRGACWHRPVGEGRRQDGGSVPSSRAPARRRGRQGPPASAHGRFGAEDARRRDPPPRAVEYRRQLDVGRQREDLVEQVAPVSAGAAVGRDATGIRPPSYGVGAHAEQVGDLGDAEPGRPVGSLLTMRCGNGSHPPSIGRRGA